MTAPSPERRGSINIDDEGTPSHAAMCSSTTESWWDIMQDRLNARLMGTASLPAMAAAKATRDLPDAPDDEYLHAGR